ncbi:unnamed protein product, partial [Polarella glacialis]
MVDNTQYPNGAAKPELTLSQIFVKQNLPEATAKRVFAADLDPDVAAREDTLRFLAAVWNQYVLLAKAKADQRTAIEPYKKTIERMIRDHTVNNMLPFYELAEIRLRSEEITYKSRVAENADALLELAKVMQRADVISDEDVMNRIMAFHIGLEYTVNCPYRTSAYTEAGAAGGSLAYLIMLDDQRQQFRDTTGQDPMWFALIVDRKIRSMIAKLCFDRRSKYNTYGSAMEEVLANRRFLWSDARSECQRGDQGRRRDRAPDRGTPADEDKFTGTANPGTPPTADRKEKNKARAEKANILRQKEEFKQLRLDQGEMAPKEVWDAVKAPKKTFKKRCEFWNTQAGSWAGPRRGLTPIQEKEIRSWSWNTMPDQPPEWLKGQKVFLEIFAGQGKVEQGHEISRLVLFCTPCTTMSKARKNDGGPRPLRSSSMIEGFMRAKSKGDGGLTDAEYRQVLDGSALDQLTLDVIKSLGAGVILSVENPANSFLWEFRDFAEFMKSDKVFKVVFDMCAYVYGMMLCMAYAMIFQVKGVAAGSMVNNEEIFRERQRGWSSADQRFWKNRAEKLRGATVEQLNAIPDPALRRLYCGSRSKLTGREPFVSFLHIALWREMAKKTGSVDAKYVEEMLAGLPIVGAVARPDRWPELDREPEIGMKEYVRKAWVKREQIENRIKRKGLSKNTRVVWESSLKDCEKGFSLGPFYDQDRVRSVVGDKTWVCTERIDVEQKGGRVREVDSATVSMSNKLTHITEPEGTSSRGVSGVTAFPVLTPRKGVKVKKSRDLATPTVSGRGWGKRGGFSAELGDDDEPGVDVDVTDSVAGSEGSVGSGAGARSKGKRSSEQTTSDSNRRSGRVAFAGGQDTDGRPAPGEGEVTRSFSLSVEVRTSAVRLRVDGKRSVSTEISVDEPDSPGRIRMRAGESAGGRAKLMDQACEVPEQPGDGGTDVCVSRSPIRRHQGALSVTHTMGVVPSASLQLIINNDGDLKDYYVLEDRTLGKGTYGVVVPAKVKSTKAPRAVKSIAKVRMKEHVGALKYEIDIMKKIDHPYIIMLYEIFEDLEKLYLVTELCRGGHLHGYVTQNGRLNESAAALAMQQLFRAVFYLHRSFICHRDLKSENLLLSESGPFGGAGANNNCLKVADFGLSCIFKPKQIFTAMVGTPSHMAPEVRARKYNFACDYWSCGVIMYYVISGSLPFNMSTPEASRYKVAFSSTSWAEVSQK